MKKIDTEDYTELCVWGAAFINSLVINGRYWMNDESVFLFEWDRASQTDTCPEVFMGFRLVRRI